jgi:hypothetical protein
MDGEAIMNKRGIMTVMAAAAIMVQASVACATSVSAPQFEITTLDIKPAQIAAGQTATVTARVTNTGKTEGVYDAMLTVDGLQADTQQIDIGPGSTETVTFSVSEDTAGDYNVAIGGVDSKLTVEPRLVAKEVELKYDDGNAKDYLSVNKPCTGYVSSFAPPSVPFIIKTVRIYGLVYGGPEFLVEPVEIQIWNADKKVIYSARVSGKRFPLLAHLLSDIEDKGAWVDVNIPEVTVSGDFYINVYTGTTTGQGFRMGSEDNVINTHSDVTIRDENGIDTTSPQWPYPATYWYGDKSRVNWMLRVVGNAMVPQE